MKLVCDACQSKYAISDDKVRGKVFKIRCKKCSNVIVVRGTAETAEPPPPDSAADDGWYAVVDQVQVGPLAASEIERRYAAGDLDGDTYVWREGMADWLPLAEVAPFASLVTSAPGSAALPPPEPEAGDLFGAPPTEASDAHAGRLRGERNESSVLFSLNKLTELAVPQQRPAAAATAAAPRTEGSGLIDIRSMASAYLGPSGTAKAVPASAGIGSIDDLPVFAGTGFTEPAVIVPFAAHSPRPKLLYAAIGASALAVVAAAIVVIVVVRDRPASANTTPAPDPITHTTRATGESPANGAPSESTDSHASGAHSESHDNSGANESHATVAANRAGEVHAASGVSNEAHADGAASPHPTGSPGRGATTESHARANRASGAPAGVPANRAETRRGETTRAEAAPRSNPLAAAAAADSCDQVHCMVSGDDPCCARLQQHGAAAPAHTANPNLPEKLDRGMIKDGVGKVMGKAQGCGGETSARGTVRIAVKVDGEGRITSATVRETPDPALGACVLAAMKQASFAKTQAGGSFAFPFVF